MSKIISALYNPETDCVEVTLDNQFRSIFNCRNYNAQVTFADPLDIAYLRKGGLQGYVEAMGEWN